MTTVSSTAAAEQQQWRRQLEGKIDGASRGEMSGCLRRSARWLVGRLGAAEGAGIVDEHRRQLRRGSARSVDLGLPCSICSSRKTYWKAKERPSMASPHGDDSGGEDDEGHGGQRSGANKNDDNGAREGDDGD